MIKFNKVLNSKIVSLIIACVFLLNNNVYGIDLAEKSHLRKHLDFNDVNVTPRYRCVLFDLFLENPNEMYLVPDQFAVTDEDILKPSRKMIERFRKIASEFLLYFNSLSADRRNRLLQAKFVSAGADRYLSDMAGYGNTTFLQNGGKIIAVEDFSGTINFRALDRSLRIPHCVYKVTLMFSDGKTGTYFIKIVQNGAQNDLIRQRCEKLINLQSYPFRIGYYPRDDKSTWLISEDIPNAYLISHMPQKAMQKLVRSIAANAALNHALLVGGAHLLYVQEDSTVTSIDHEFMLPKERLYSKVYISDTRKGQGEIHLLRSLPNFATSLHKVDLLEQFERSYVYTFLKIVEKKEGIRRIILKLKGSEEMAKNFDESLKANPVESFEVMAENLFDWLIREEAMKCWQEIWEGSKRLEIKKALSGYARKDNPDAKTAMAILTDDDYNMTRKLKELSIRSEVMEEGAGIIRYAVSNVSETNAAAMDRDMGVLIEEKRLCMNELKMRREAYLAEHIRNSTDINDLTAVVIASGSQMSDALLDKLIDALEAFSMVGGRFRDELFTANMTRIINESSSALRKELRQSARLTRMIFGVDPVRADSTYFDHKTLVLKEALNRYAKSGQRIAEIGPGCNATLSIYLAKRLEDISIVGGEFNTDFIQTGHKAIEQNKVSGKVRLVESDVVSNVPGGQDLIFWNIPYVTSSREHMAAVAPGLFDFLDEFATEDDEGVNLIRRYLAEAPGRLAPNGTLIFASNAYYIPEKIMRELIDASSLEVVDTIRLSYNTSVAFVLKKKGSSLEGYGAALNTRMCI